MSPPNSVSRSRSPLDFLKNIIFVLVIFNYGSSFLSKCITFGIKGTLVDYFNLLLKNIILTAKKVPIARSKINSQIEKIKKDVRQQLVIKMGDEEPIIELPEKGLSEEAIQKKLEIYRSAGTVKWEEGKRAVYHGGETLSRICVAAYEKFFVSNPLHPDVFPGVRQMEAEVVSMVLNMFHAPPTAGGSITSGGTESILLACKTYRDKYRETKGILEPEMIVPETIHAAFDKAAHYFGIKLISIPVGSTTYKVRVDLVKKAINRNTIMIAASCPNFPHGIIDDIQSLASLALQNDIGMHVDACLGSFVVAFMEKAEYTFPQFDFRVKGVTSISVDTHKYGFAPKGSSLIMYNCKELRESQYFVAPSWTGGIYASPTFAGSRSGAIIAGAWACMMSFGEEGYIQTTKSIISKARRIAEGICVMNDMKVIGEPLVSVVAFETKAPLNVYSVAEVMRGKGWHLNKLQRPNAVHIAVTMLTDAELFLIDLEEAIKTIKADPEKYEGGDAAVYGLASSIPDRTIVEDIAIGFLDALYEV